jgi:hypothetical protein
LKVLDACQVFCDVLALGVPRVDAVSEMGAIVYRHFSLPLPLRLLASRPRKPGFSSEPIRRSARQGPRVREAVSIEVNEQLTKADKDE